MKQLVTILQEIQIITLPYKLKDGKYKWRVNNQISTSLKVRNNIVEYPSLFNAETIVQNWKDLRPYFIKNGWKIERINDNDLKEIQLKPRIKLIVGQKYDVDTILGLKTLMYKGQNPNMRSPYGSPYDWAYLFDYIEDGGRVNGNVKFTQQGFDDLIKNNKLRCHKTQINEIQVVGGKVTPDDVWNLWDKEPIDRQKSLDIMKNYGWDKTLHIGEDFKIWLNNLHNNELRKMYFKLKPSFK